MMAKTSICLLLAAAAAVGADTITICQNNGECVTNGICEDNGPRGPTSAAPSYAAPAGMTYNDVEDCSYGHDCADCGPRLSEYADDDITCDNRCRSWDGRNNNYNNNPQYALDGTCDTGSLFSVCDEGTDCADCGPEKVSTSSAAGSIIVVVILLCCCSPCICACLLLPCFGIYMCMKKKEGGSGQNQQNQCSSGTQMAAAPPAAYAQPAQAVYAQPAVAVVKQVQPGYAVPVQAVPVQAVPVQAVPVQAVTVQTNPAVVAYPVA